MERKIPIDGHPQHHSHVSIDSGLMVGRATLSRAAAASGSLGGGGRAAGEASHFARLLRSSRLATHSPVIPQVYSASDAHIGRGDFGLKRPLPSRKKPIGSLRNIDVRALDTREGQTAWSEREHEVMIAKRLRELNIKLTDESVEKDYSLEVEDQATYMRGINGPRISTTFDPSTRRSVPTAYEEISDPDLRKHLQSEARLGRGPVYRDAIYAGEAIASGRDREGPFGRIAGLYTHSINVPVDYQSMDEKTFERYLQQIRKQRPQFRRQQAAENAELARRQLVRSLNQERQTLLREAMAEGKDQEAALKAAPPVVSVEDLPLPEIAEEGAKATSGVEDDAVRADLWDESRDESSTAPVWRHWLEQRDIVRVSQPQDQRLPHSNTTPNGGNSGASLHPQGGLQYGQPDKIQTQVYNDGFSARILETAHDNNQSGRSTMYRRNTSGIHGMHVAVGGQIAFMANIHHPSDGSTLKHKIDWSQRRPEQGVVTVKPFHASRSVGGSRTASERHAIDVWGGQSVAELNKSPTALADLRKAAERASKKSDPVDALRLSQLPEQYGTISMYVHGTEKGGYNNLARGRPGSNEWVGSIDKKLGFQSGRRDVAPVNYATQTDYSQVLRSTRLSDHHTNEALVNSGRRLGESLYSKQEKKVAQQHRERKQAQAQASQSPVQGSASMHIDKIVEMRQKRQGLDAAAEVAGGPSSESPEKQ